MSVGFHLLAHSAAINVLSDEGAHAGPPIAFLDVPFGIGTSGVPGSRVIMMELQNALPEVRGDVGSVLKIKDAFVHAPV